jgi:acid stress-induced BolA-like protein IbaG/YrbA
MVRPEDVERYISEKLPCDFIEVRGDGQHFEAVIVSAVFTGKSMVQQHQAVYQALGERMREEIHALSMKTYSPEQWQNR